MSLAIFVPFAPTLHIRRAFPDADRALLPSNRSHTKARTPAAGALPPGTEPLSPRTEPPAPNSHPHLGTFQPAAGSGGRSAPVPAAPRAAPADTCGTARRVLPRQGWGSPGHPPSRRPRRPLPHHSRIPRPRYLPPPGTAAALPRPPPFSWAPSAGGGRGGGGGGTGLDRRAFPPMGGDTGGAAANGGETEGKAKAV